MLMSAEIILELYCKTPTDFQLQRVERALAVTYPVPITVFLSDVFIDTQRAVGIVIGHDDPGQYEQRADGHIFRSTAIRKLWKAGRYWVASTDEGQYVLTSFLKVVGRKSLRALIEQAVRPFDSVPNKGG